jgi:predicted ATPase
MNKRNKMLYIACFSSLATAGLFGMQEISQNQSMALQNQMVPLFSQPQDRLIGFTGGPGVGKSSVIALLKSKGMQVVPETFTLLYEQAKAHDAIADFFAEPLALRYKLMQQQIRSEDARDKTKPVFIDETALGVLFFGNKWHVHMPRDLYTTAENRRYDMVFVFDSLPKELYKTTEVRREQHEESADIHNFLTEKYRETGLITVDVPFGTVEQRAEFIMRTIKQQYQYVDIIPNVINCFARRNSLYPLQAFFGPIALIEVAIEGAVKPYRFFGIHVDELHRIAAGDIASLKRFFADFKQKLARSMQVKITDGLQVIGDSNQFSREGTAWVRDFMQDRFDRSGLIEYGFTGYKTAYKVDVNTLVNEYANEHPGQANRILANIVGQTTVALNQWGTSGSSYIRNFVVVYNDAGVVDVPRYNEKFEKISGFTTFGDDIVLSDYLFNAAQGDRFICLEGGAQSFKQAVNGLILNIPITCVYNIRKSENEKFFSAARFFNLINNAYDADQEPTIDDIKQIYKKYVVSLDSLWDARRPDYQTKKILFEKAIKEFIDQGIYEKIPHLCTFYDAKID